MRFTLVLAVLASIGCGHTVKSRPSSDVVRPEGFQYCILATVKYGAKIHNVYACTADKDMCNKGVRDAKGAAGKLVGVRSITDCKFVKH